MKKVWISCKCCYKTSTLSLVSYFYFCWNCFLKTPSPFIALILKSKSPNWGGPRLFFSIWTLVSSHSFISGCLWLFVFPTTHTLNLPYSVNSPVLASLWRTGNSFPWNTFNLYTNSHPGKLISACGYFVINKEFQWTDRTMLFLTGALCWY